MGDIASALTHLQEKTQLLLKRLALLEKENIQLKATLTKEQNLVRELTDIKEIDMAIKNLNP